MSYITKEFYDNTFNGTTIPNVEFERLADIALDVIEGVCTVKPTEKDRADVGFLKAVCYQIEMLYLQGGVDAIIGFSESALASGSESLGDYSAGGTGKDIGANAVKVGGIPVSWLSIYQLKKLGLMSRWAYAEFYRDGKS